MPNGQRGMQVAGHVGSAPTAPVAPILIYDGQCGFCRRWIDRARRFDRRRVVRFLPRQDDKAEELSGRSSSELAQAAHLVRPDGEVFAGAAAARELIGYLPGGKLVVAISRLPGVMPMAETVYRWIARRFGPVD